MDRLMLDRVISLQTQIIEAYRRKHKLLAEELFAVIKKYNLSKFIQDNYELLHINGVASL